MGNIEDNTWEMLTLEERIELENLCNQLRLLGVSRAFYCQSEIEGETICPEQCEHCKEYYKTLKQ
jgi:hypothetical protein